jgi:hypothetical protein
MVFRSPDQSLGEAVTQLFESARRNEKSAPRKHHLVPSSYLKRWAIDDQIRVTETDNKNSYVTSPDKATRNTDFYSLSSEDLDNDEVPPLLIETMLSRIEGGAKEVIDVLIADGPRVLDERQALSLVTYLAFQVTRGRSFRRRISSMSNGMMLLMWGNLTDEGIADLIHMGGNEPDEESVRRFRGFIEEWKTGRWEVGPQPAAKVMQAAEQAEKLTFYFLTRPWRIYHSDLSLITCDEPVVPVARYRGDLRKEPGVATAGLIMFPLDPHHLLVMFHPGHALDDLALYPELIPEEASEVNLFLAAHSHRWLIEGPKRSLTKTLIVPRLPKDDVTFDKVASSTSSDTEGPREIIWSTVSTRWSEAFKVPPHPVDRWWRRARLPGLQDFPYEPEAMKEVLFNILPY